MKTNYDLPFKTVHRLMKRNCDCKLSTDSVEQLILFLESVVGDVTICANVFAQHDDRKTLTSKDINLAILTLYGNMKE